jgi:hypothetical protein
VTIDSNSNELRKKVYRELELIQKAKNRIDICVDSAQPQLLIGTNEFKQSLLDAKSRGIKIRCITGTNNSNVSYCKELMNITSEIRHCEGVRPNFMVSERECLLTPLGVLKGESRNGEQQPTQHLVYSDLKEIVDQQQYIFDNLWDKGVSVADRIKKIEKDEDSHEYKINVIRSPSEIVEVISRHIEESNELLVCTICGGGMRFMADNFLDAQRKVVMKQKRGEHRGIRYIGDVNRNNVNAANKFMDVGVQLRHLGMAPPMSFSVTDKQVVTTIDDTTESGTKIQSLLVSDDPVYLNHFKKIFEGLWKNGTDAKIMIGDVAEGKEPDYELNFAKTYINEIYVEISKMKNSARRRGVYTP